MVFFTLSNITYLVHYPQKNITDDEITILVNDPKLNASDVPALQSDEK